MIPGSGVPPLAARSTLMRLVALTVAEDAEIVRHKVGGAAGWRSELDLDTSDLLNPCNNK